MPSGHDHKGFWAYSSPCCIRRIAVCCGLFAWGFIQLISFLSCYKITHSSSEMSNEKRSSVSDSSHGVLRELIGVVITLNTSILSGFYDELKKNKCCFKQVPLYIKSNKWMIKCWHFLAVILLLLRAISNANEEWCSRAIQQFSLMGNVNCWEVARKQLLEYGVLQHVL